MSQPPRPPAPPPNAVPAYGAPPPPQPWPVAPPPQHVPYARPEPRPPAPAYGAPPYPPQPYPEPQPHPQASYRQAAHVPAGPRPERPLLASVAAGIWIGFGALGAIFGVILTITSNPIFAMLVLFCLVFVMVGVQTLRGTAKDTLGNAIGSILFGAFALYYTTYSGDLLSLLLSVVQGLALVGAGVIALIARRDYIAWFASRQFGPKT